MLGFLVTVTQTTNTARIVAAVEHSHLFLFVFWALSYDSCHHLPPHWGTVCYDRGTKEKGNVCVHKCIGCEGRGPGEGGGSRRRSTRGGEARPGLGHAKTPGHSTGKSGLVLGWENGMFQGAADKSIRCACREGKAPNISTAPFSY